MKEKDLLQIQVLLRNNNNIVQKDIADMLNAVLRCIPNTTGVISLRTKAEQIAIAKRHTHDKTV